MTHDPTTYLESLTPDQRAAHAMADQTEVWGDRLWINASGPARRFVRLDTVEYVTRPKEGGVIVVGRRGAAEVHISVSDELLPELIARLRRPGK